jgi:PTH1 family peptidyl-tRNA hydrolase
MKLIVGVGNPGVKYARTRLNAGFIAVDKIAQQLANTFPRLAHFEWKTTDKYQFLIVKDDPLTLIVKPRTYIKNIGTSVRNLVRFYNNIQENPKLKLRDELNADTSSSFRGNPALKVRGGRYETDLNDLHIIHYDAGLKLGEYKIQNERLKMLHESVNLIEKSLGNDCFWKVRVGVKNRNYESGIMNYGKKKIAGEDFLLQELTDVEFAILRQVADSIIRDLDLTIK